MYESGTLPDGSLIAMPAPATPAPAAVVRLPLIVITSPLIASAGPLAFSVVWTGPRATSKLWRASTGGRASVPAK